MTLVSLGEGRGLAVAAKLTVAVRSGGGDHDLLAPSPTRHPTPIHKIFLIGISPKKDN
jgi:hypothetical protein